MKVSFGKGFTKELGDNKKLDITLYEHKWLVEIEMSLWENDNCIKGSSKKYFRFEKLFVPRKTIENLSIKRVNKQSQNTAGVNIFQNK